MEITCRLVDEPPNTGMQRTALRAAADAGRSATEYQSET
jgi:hypothetical protein